MAPLAFPHIMADTVWMSCLRALFMLPSARIPGARCLVFECRAKWNGKLPLKCQQATDNKVKIAFLKSDRYMLLLAVKRFDYR